MDGGGGIGGSNLSNSVSAPSGGQPMIPGAGSS